MSLLTWTASSEFGDRVQRLRLIAGLGQVEFANRLGVASGTVSMIENSRATVSDDLLAKIGMVLGCTRAYLLSGHSSAPATRPWLRAYADAPKRTVDRQIADCVTAVEAIEVLRLPLLPNRLPAFDGDLDDDAEVESFARAVRSAAEIGEEDVVGNAIRAAERLGCIVLPMQGEAGRHLGLSLRANLVPVICVSRPSLDPASSVPGDRQRFTVCHELGHLTMHMSLGPPQSAEEASRIERQAHLFAGAFLAPGDAMLDELSRFGGRVTLSTLSKIKERWGIAIKALVVRFRQLGVIDSDHARSLYKQISARGWNKEEPVPVGNESALWFSKALARVPSQNGDAIGVASLQTGLGRSHFERWTDWSASPSASGDIAPVLDLTSARRRTSSLRAT